MRSTDFNQFLVTLTDAIQCKCEHVIKQCIYLLNSGFWYFFFKNSSVLRLSIYNNNNIYVFL